MEKELESQKFSATLDDIQEIATRFGIHYQLMNTPRKVDILMDPLALKLILHIAILEEELKSHGWTDVNKELPEKGERVEVYNNSGESMYRFYSIQFGRWENGNLWEINGVSPGREYKKFKPTHWRRIRLGQD